MGESHKTFWDRAQEHSADLRTKNEKNSLVKHWQECHGELDTPKYSYKVLKKCKSSLQRQIWEAILIDKDHSLCDIEINQKGEFGINLLPKMMPTLNGELHTPEMKSESQNRTKKRPNSAETDARNSQKSNFEGQYSQRRKRAKLNALDSQAYDKQQFLR